MAKKLVQSLTKGHPTGTILGRLSSGTGPTEYLNVSDLAQSLALAGSAGSTAPPANLPNSGVTAGSYTNTNLTVDAQGIITAASSGSLGLLPLITPDSPPGIITATPGECIGVPQ